MDNNQINKSYRLVYSLIWPLFNFLFPMETIGRENIPDGPCIICPNHYSWNDPIYVAFAFTKKNPLRAMAKMELINIPILGKVFLKIGAIGVKRDGSDISAIKTSLKTLKENKLLIFPEGTRSNDENTNSGKDGAIFLALKTKVPVVPVYLEQKKRLFRKTRVIIGESFLVESQNKKATTEEISQNTEKLMNKIYELKNKAI